MEVPESLDRGLLTFQSMADKLRREATPVLHEDLTKDNHEQSYYALMSIREKLGQLYQSADFLDDEDIATRKKYILLTVRGLSKLMKIIRLSATSSKFKSAGGYIDFFDYWENTGSPIPDPEDACPYDKDNEFSHYCSWMDAWHEAELDNLLTDERCARDWLESFDQHQ